MCELAHMDTVRTRYPRRLVLVRFHIIANRLGAFDARFAHKMRCWWAVVDFAADFTRPCHVFTSNRCMRETLSRADQLARIS
jgi:hypothetical protein